MFEAATTKRFHVLHVSRATFSLQGHTTTAFSSRKGRISDYVDRSYVVRHSKKCDRIILNANLRLIISVTLLRACNVIRASFNNKQPLIVDCEKLQNCAKGQHMKRFPCII